MVPTLNAMITLTSTTGRLRRIFCSCGLVLSRVASVTQAYYGGRGTTIGLWSYTNVPSTSRAGCRRLFQPLPREGDLRCAPAGPDATGACHPGCGVSAGGWCRLRVVRSRDASAKVLFVSLSAEW
jgi:hypothetical protein